MRKLQNENGIALLTALMFTLICLGMILAMMELLLSETKMSASQKNYRNSLDASYGGVELITREFIPRLFVNYSSSLIGVRNTFGHDISAGGGIGLEVTGNLGTKLANPTAAWDPSISKTLDAKDHYDVKFQLKSTDSESQFNIYGKIVDTISGNSDTSGIDYIDTGVGVAGAGAGIAPKHTPALYTVEVQGERSTNTNEKAKLSVLYAY